MCDTFRKVSMTSDPTTPTQNEQTCDEGLMLVAVVVVVKRDRSVLALCRSTSSDAFPGAWECVSGRVRKGEEPLSAARRELLEETGLDGVLDTRPIDVYASRRGELPMMVLAYTASCPDGDVTLSSEHEDFKWCSPEQFRSITEFDRLADVVEKLFRSEYPR